MNTNQSEQAKGPETAESIMRKYALSQERALTMNYRADEVLEMMEEYAGVYFDQHQQSQPGLKQWVSEWIDVKGRLPEDEKQEVMCSSIDSVYRSTFQYNYRTNRFESYEYPFGARNITHWQPQLQPPNSTTTPKSDMVSKAEICKLLESEKINSGKRAPQINVFETLHNQHIDEIITKIKEI